MKVDFLPALNRALARAWPGFERVDAITRLSGGASQETWSFEALIHGAHEPMILRRAPGGERGVESASAVPLETEAIVIEAARTTGVAAPRVRYVMQFEDGVGHG